MLIAELIDAKRRGRPIPEDDLRHLLHGYTHGSVPDYQMAAFLMAVVFQGMSPDELEVWVDGMLHSGDVLDFSEIPGPKVDKHSTGGVGDKVSLVLAPLATTIGLRVPMISGRGLGHTGGTLDKLQSIPGFEVMQPIERFRELVRDVGCGLIGQTGELAPADKQLYALRDVTATVDCIPLIASSIMSKKMAEGIDALVLDIKVGSGAFMKTAARATELGEVMIQIGRSLGKPVRALLTDMNQPLGRTVGNALEVVESVETLRGEGPQDLTDLTIELVGHMAELGGLTSDLDSARAELRAKLDDGSALEAFGRIIEAQGGDRRILDDTSRLPQAPHTTVLHAWSDGHLVHTQTTEIGNAAVELGAGRRTMHDVIDPAVGLTMHARLGDPLIKGQPLVTIHYASEPKRDACIARLKRAIRIADTPAPAPKLLLGQLG